MYNILMIYSVILSFFFAYIGGNLNSKNCQDKNFYIGMFGFLLLSLPTFISYLEEINTPQSEKLKNLELAKKVRWILPQAYAVQKNPGALLVISIFFGVISISIMFSKTCN